MTDPLSVRAFARAIGVSHPAVLKAVKSGRLKQSIRQNGRGHAEIVDLELARREWSANAGKVHRLADHRDAAAAPVTVTSEPLPPRSEPAADAENTLVEAQRLLVLERLREKRLAVDQTLGTLVKRTDVAKVLFEGDRIIRETLLNLPARLSGTLAAEMDAGRVHTTLDAAIREALQATADRFEQQAANG